MIDHPLTILNHYTNPSLGPFFNQKMVEQLGRAEGTPSPGAKKSQLPTLKGWQKKQ